jgi:hypothetical protein
MEMKKVWPKLEFKANMNPANNQAIFDLKNSK